MNSKWIIEPIDEDGVLGWNIVDSYSNEPEGYDSVAIVLANNNIEESKSNAALISTAPELLVACKRALTYLDKNLPLYQELEYLVNKADGLEGDIESLSYFDNMSDMYKESVLNLDFEQNKCSFVTNAQMSDLFSFHNFGGGTGLIVLNISGDFMYDENFDDAFLRYPIGHLISKKVYDDFIVFMTNKYENLKAFMTAFEAQNNDVSLRSFLLDMFYDEFAPKYHRQMTLKNYLETYALMLDSDELYMDFNLPKFLENCPYTMHSDIEVSYHEQKVSGIILYREKEDKFFVYNQEQKSATFFMIPNVDEETEVTILEFIDLIQT